MAAPIAWMPMYWDDYLADTYHLEQRHHGAYVLLIAFYWRHGKLPTDDESLATITKSLSLSAWLEIRPVIAALFTPDWRHKRIDFEMKFSKKMIKAKSDGGKMGAKSRWQLKKRGNAPVMAVPLHSNAPLPLPLPLPNNQDTYSEPSLEFVGGASKKSKPAREDPKGTRWPPNKAIPENWITDAHDARDRHKLPPIDLSLEAERFVNWAVNAKANGVKKDWHRAFINWSTDPNKRGKANGHDTRQSGRTAGDVFGDLYDKSRNRNRK